MTMHKEEGASAKAMEAQSAAPAPAEIAIVNVPITKPPAGIKQEEVEYLKKRASELAKLVETSTGSKEMETIDSAANLGVQAQRNAASELNLLRVRMGEMLTREGAAGAVTKDMMELRMSLNQINPSELAPKGVLGKMADVIPFSKQLKPLRNAIEKVAIRYEPVSKQITLIEIRLREGRAMLLKDNIELRKLYEHVEAQQLPIEKNSYLGELLMQELQALIDRTDDPVKRERVRGLLHDVAMRVQDLRTMEEVNEQFFVSIEMTRQNNTRLGQAVERTLTLATNVVMVGLAIQTALARQKRVMEATQRTREFMGTVIVANAATIKRHTAELGDVYNNPVIAIDKVIQAHTDLVEAIDMAGRLQQQGIDQARENITKLSQLSTELREKASALREPEKSTEA